MKRQKIGITGNLLFMLFLAIMTLALTGGSVMAGEKVSIKEGTYYIKAVNGNAKGQVLYWNEDADDQNICMMFEPCGGKHAENEIWYITKNRNFDDYYGIYLYRTYTGNKDKSNRIEIDNLTGRDQPYLLSTKGPHVFCGPYSNQDDAFEFIRESGDNNLKNLSIWSRDDRYRFNRHKVIRAFRSDIIYVNANKDNDTNNKLWELVPVNYERNLDTTKLSVTAAQNGALKINWDKFRNKVKNSSAWKNAKYIEIQYSTDKEFLKNVKTKKIQKGTVNKERAKSKLSSLKIQNTYYLRARLVDQNGTATNWTKTVTIKPKE